MSNKIKTVDLKRLLDGWEGKYEFTKQSGDILYVNMLYTIEKIVDYAHSLQVIDELEKAYGSQILYELNTEEEKMTIKVRVTPQTVNDFLKIKRKFKTIDNHEYV